MSFKKLNNLFIESDKFNQIVEPVKTSDVQNSIPTELSTPAMTPSKFAAQLSKVDFLPNTKAPGFKTPEPPNTEFKNVSQIPISQHGIGGMFGNMSYEPSIPLQTRFDLDISRSG